MIALFPKQVRWRVLLLIAALFPITLWQSAVLTKRIALEQIHEHSLEMLDVFGLQVRSELEKFEILPKILAVDTGITQALSMPADDKRIAQVIDQANRYLQYINETVHASNIYAVNTQGIAIAASNWNEAQSFIGIDVSHRTYFQTAINGDVGRYFALGFTSNERGYYFSAPVRQSGEISSKISSKIIGVVVVKIGVNRFETSGQWGDDKVAIADTYGVIFASNDPDWQFKTIRPLHIETLQAIRESRQYGDVGLSSLPIINEKRIDDLGNLVEIKENTGSQSSTGSDAASTTREYLIQRTVMPDVGWDIYVFSNTAPVQKALNLVLAFTVLFMMIVALVALYLLQRRATIDERLAAEKTLRKAHDELETRVKQQTAELRISNRHLQREIEERKQAENELIQAGKLAALGQLSAGIVHELNQPLAAIRSYANNSLTFLDRQRYDDAKDNLIIIGELVQRIAKITSHLKTFARKTPGKITAVSFKQVIDYAITLIEPQQNRETVEIVQELPQEDPLVQGEPVRLEQVVVNLLKNAIDAMHGQDQPKTIYLQLTLSAERARLMIRDTGPGIAEENLAQIFDPFFTTKEVGEGLGLGLSISNKIVREFGGSLTADNHRNGGAVFTVTLLRADKPGRLDDE